MKENKILLFIPVYNCEKQIRRTLEKLTKISIDIFEEILIIDNKSKDNTVATAISELKKLSKTKTKLIQNTENRNLGGSHKTAFEYAIKNNFTHVVVLHGDDQGTLEDLLPYLREEQTYKLDALLGARFHFKSKLKNYSLFRTLGNISINLIATLVARRIIYDMGSGLNLFSVNSLKQRFYLNFPNDLTFNYFMLTYYLVHNFKIQFFPHSWEESDQISNVNLLRQGATVAKILFLFAINPNKLLSVKNDSTVNYTTLYSSSS